LYDLCLLRAYVCNENTNIRDFESRTQIADRCVPRKFAEPHHRAAYEERDDIEGDGHALRARSKSGDCVNSTGFFTWCGESPRCSPSWPASKRQVGAPMGLRGIPCSRIFGSQHSLGGLEPCARSCLTTSESDDFLKRMAVLRSTASVGFLDNPR
jgi:hypothetical protein